MRLNTKSAALGAPYDLGHTTHEGARAARTSAIQELRRSVLACLLWEDTFYESGEEIASRIATLSQQVSWAELSLLAVEARMKFNLRHVPLLLAVLMAKRNENDGDQAQLVEDTVASVIQRPDELAEILAVYAKVNGRTGTKKLNKLSHALSRGIARAFTKFNEYGLAKYNRDNEIKLRDVLFLTRPRSTERGQKALWRRLAKNELKTPDTWEVAISATQGENKKAEWARLLREEKLGALALLRNLRNMTQAGVEDKLIRQAILAMNAGRVLPFRFIAAAQHAPQFEDVLEQAMFKSLSGYPKLLGKTALVIDDSGSMGGKLSAKSDLNREDAAAALAILVREVCQQAEVIVFANNAKVIAPRRGFALKDAIERANVGGSTYTDKAVALANNQGYDRIIVITDEQSHTNIPNPLPGTKAYFINVAPYQNGIGYGRWTHIDGFSESVLDYIREIES